MTEAGGEAITRPIATLIGVVALFTVAVVGAVLALSVAGVALWNSGELNESDQQMRQEAESLLTLAAEGRYVEVTEFLAESCPRLEPQSAEDLNFFFRGLPFKFELNRVSSTENVGSVSGRLDADSYAHIVGVRVERDNADAPWRACSIGVAGYT